MMAYIYNQPVVFIETNIRSVYFHHFFQYDENVTDAQLRLVVEATFDSEHPREFYWALMDYGSWLKRQGMGKIATSKSYKKQSPLEGSVRQIRGRIIAALSKGDHRMTGQLANVVGYDERFEPALAGLVRDGLVTQRGDRVHLTK